MNNYHKKLNSLGIDIPSILLPSPSLDIKKWPVIACDQFTQDRDYWEKVKTFAGSSPASLNLIFPEVFLSDGDSSRRIADIHSTMKHYLGSGVFADPVRGFIYVERDTPFQKKRRGLMAAIDLEHYDWKPSSRTLIRSTEGTVADRLPPRMDIRRGAPLELPHVLLLIDDDTDSLLPELAGMVTKDAPLYHTPLMMDSGNVSGRLINDENALSFIAGKLDELYRRSFNRYGNDENPFLFAVGDGNHSLAAAKGIWEEYKTCPENRDSPYRFALVEIENIYDSAIQFEPIHRLVFDTGFDEILTLLSKLPGYSCIPVKSKPELSRLMRSLHLMQPSAPNCFGIVSGNRYALIETSASGIASACLQPLLDKHVDSKSVDYIHDEEELFRLTENPGRLTTGIFFPPVQKAGLFETVARLGPLPRKSFSMGHSCEKRFYYECRSLN